MLPPPMSNRSIERSILGIQLTTGLIFFGQGAVVASVPFYARTLGASVAMAGFASGIFAVARLTVNIPAGAIADRYGGRVPMIAGALMYALGNGMCAFSSSMNQLLLWRFLVGAGSALYITNALALVAVLAQPAIRARAITNNQTAAAIGFTLGPVFGGWLADRFGFTIPFTAVAMLAGAAAVWSLLTLPRVKSRNLARRKSTTTIGGLLRSKTVLCILASSGVLFFVRMGGQYTIFPLRAISELGYSAKDVGTFLTVAMIANVISLLVVARFSDLIGRKRTLVAGLFLMGVGHLIAASAISRFWCTVALALFGIGSAPLNTVPPAYISDLSPPEHRGRMIGLLRSVGDVGFLSGPTVLGSAADATSLRRALQLSGLAALLVLVLVATLASDAPSARRARLHRA